MRKVSVTGPRTRLEEVLEAVHDLGLMDLEEYSGEIETGQRPGTQDHPRTGARPR
ncbi:MAG: hypothetical protein ACLFTA_00710 [Candidatus Nanohaloarchaea archaeon]